MREEITTLLEMVNIRRAVVIDDAYDVEPLAKDLAQDGDRWGQFFEDLNADDKLFIEGLFPNYRDIRADELRGSDAFVRFLFENRSRLRDEIITPLFERYSRDRAQDLEYLETLTTCLRGYGLECSTSGRDFSAEAKVADLIVIDLFLGSAQDDDAIGNSVNGLQKIIKERLANPPLVILMSRSSRLEEKRETFRDQSGLFESAFRIIQKTELRVEGKLARLLNRLAEHYQDSTRLAAFLYRWTTGITSAQVRTANLIRTLDLADLAQIKQLLLTDERELTGSYLVDVFDLVLQHEVEREGALIDAAINLNDLSSEKYPPPYVVGSPDLQALVFRYLFQNSERLRLRDVNENPVGFGDLLGLKQGTALSAAQAPAAAAQAPAVNPAPPASVPVANTELQLPERFCDLDPADVFVVLTPACDLQRNSAKRILLLKGTLVPLTRTVWNSRVSAAFTAVFVNAFNDRFRIEWDFKHIETASRTELEAFLQKPDGLKIFARLRNAHALELQQKLLSSLGRVGLVAAMPATFAVEVVAYLPNPDGRLIRIDIPSLEGSKGVIFIGRKGNQSATTLVLPEDACEALYEVIQSMNIDGVHPTTAQTIQELRQGGELFVIENGIDVSKLTDTKFSQITADRNGAKVCIGLIRKAGAWVEDLLTNNALLKQAGIVLVVSDEPVIAEIARNSVEPC